MADKHESPFPVSFLLTVSWVVPYGMALILYKLRILIPRPWEGLNNNLERQETFQSSLWIVWRHQIKHQHQCPDVSPSEQFKCHPGG